MFNIIWLFWFLPLADPEYQRQVEAYIERIQTAEGPKLQCRACQKITHAKSKATMVNHVEATHIQATVACNYCNKTFKARSYLKNHLKKCGPASSWSARNIWFRLECKSATFTLETFIIRFNALRFHINTWLDFSLNLMTRENHFKLNSEYVNAYNCEILSCGVQAFHQLFKDDMRGAKAEQWGQLKAHLHC